MNLSSSIMQMDLSDLAPVEPIKDTPPEELLNEPKKEKPKRKRKQPVLPQRGVDVRVINGEKRFVCAHSLRLCDRAVFIPGERQAGAFANLPCAVSYIKSNCDETNKQKELIEALATEYSQPDGNQIPQALPLKQLANFGGNLSYEMWMSDLCKWDLLTDEKGLTVDEWQTQTKRKGKSKKSKPKKKQIPKISLKPGCYMIRYQQKTESAVRPFDNEKTTLLSADRAMESFIKRTQKHTPGIGRSAIVNDRVTMLYCTIINQYEPSDPDTLQKVHNKIASLIDDDCSVYGPAILVVRKSVNFELK